MYISQQLGHAVAGKSTEMRSLACLHTVSFVGFYGEWSTPKHVKITVKSRKIKRFILLHFYNCVSYYVLYLDVFKCENVTSF